MKRAKEDSSAFQEFSEQYQRAHFGSSSAIADLERRLKQKASHMKPLEAVLARAYLANIRNDQNEAVKFARQAAEAESNVQGRAFYLLVRLGERVHPQSPFERGRGKFDYKAAANNVNRVDRSFKAKEVESFELTIALQDAYPDEFYEAFESVKSGESNDFEPLIDFLEQNPFFFRTGYVKANVLRLIKQNAERLDSAQRRRLQEVILRATEHPLREYRYYLRLARKLLDEEFLARVAALPDGEALTCYLKAGPTPGK